MSRIRSFRFVQANVVHVLIMLSFSSICKLVSSSRTTVKTERSRFTTMSVVLFIAYDTKPVIACFACFDVNARLKYLGCGSSWLL